MKKLKQYIIISLLIIVYIYICNITLLPSNVILLQDEEINFATVLGLNFKIENNNGIVEASSNTTKTLNSNIEATNAKLKLFNILDIKEINVDVIPKNKVIPIGKVIGMKLYTEGVLVVGMSEIEGKKPYASSGIKEGDMIIQINEEKINNTEDLINTVNKYGEQDITVKYVRNKNTITTSITPVKTDENKYKLGLWVRDAAAGVGTVTFYNPETNSFAALGHGIVDVDTAELINIANGELVTTNIVSINKGEKGNPGEIRGTIENSSILGIINKNTSFGVFGKLKNKSVLELDRANEIEIALRKDIKLGKAEILCELENGKTEKYEIQIEKIYNSNNKDNKSMLIKVTDQRLIDKTGGIVQRNEWSTYNTKQQVDRSCYTCFNK